MSSFYPSVLEAFRSSLGNEGYVRWMYLDDEGLVTTGQGDLIDPIAPALTLEWLKTDGSLASVNEIGVAWNTVKAAQPLKGLGGYSVKFASLTQLRLSDAEITRLVGRTLYWMMDVLIQRLPCIVRAPADAQMGLLRWAWGVGPYANYPLMFACLETENYAGASAQADWKNETLATKVQIAQFFMNAQTVKQKGLDYTVLLG